MGIDTPSLDMRSSFSNNSLSIKLRRLNFHHYRRHHHLHRRQCRHPNQSHHHCHFLHNEATTSLYYSLPIPPSFLLSLPSIPTALGVISSKPGFKAMISPSNVNAACLISAKDFFNCS